MNQENPMHERNPMTTRRNPLPSGVRAMIREKILVGDRKKEDRPHLYPDGRLFLHGKCAALSARLLREAITDMIRFALERQATGATTRKRKGLT